MELYIAVEQSLLSKVPQQPLNNQPGVFKTASLGISWHHYMWTCEPSNNPTEKVDIPPRFPSTFGNLWNSKMYPDPTSSPLFNPSVRNFSFEEMGRQKCWKSLVPFTHPPNPPRNCTVNSLSFKKTWHRPRVEAAMSSRSTRHIRNCEKVRLHKTWIIQKQFSDVHCSTESLIQIVHHQQANNTIHLHKTLTCLFLDSEWGSGGHPHTHSGVTSTHRHNFASFFPPRVTCAHRLESRAHTAIFQSHPRTQTGVTSAHRHNFASFFPPRLTHPHITWDRVGWGGVGWGGDDDILLHLHTCSKRCAMDCFGTYFTHVQTCNVTRVQSATEWTASVHTLHMSKKHCYEPDNLHTWSTQNTQL